MTPLQDGLLLLGIPNHWAERNVESASTPGQDPSIVRIFHLLNLVQCPNSTKKEKN